ncbi:hypothetical protein Tco_0886040 [Tanacetum coccineum]
MGTPTQFCVWSYLNFSAPAGRPLGQTYELTNIIVDVFENHFKFSDVLDKFDYGNPVRHGNNDRLESRLVQKKRIIYGMCSIIPKPRRSQFNDSRLRSQERMSAMLSSDATFLNGDVSFWTLFLRNSEGKRLAISMVEEAWLSKKEEL